MTRKFILSFISKIFLHLSRNQDSLVFRILLAVVRLLSFHFNFDKLSSMHGGTIDPRRGNERCVTEAFVETTFEVTSSSMNRVTIVYSSTRHAIKYYARIRTQNACVELIVVECKRA